MQETFITLGAGCFWCAEATYRQVRGVTHVEVGYANGDDPTCPSHEQVNTGETGYVEVVRIGFDPDVISLTQILEIYFTIHDPTTLNQQGEYVGTHYRSGIYVEDDRQHEVAEAVIGEINASGVLGKLIITEVQPLRNFWKATDDYQDYFAKNPAEAYCAAVIGPKVQKFRATFVAFLKN
ncbi:MAG: peptide-methionine (S)-S-oxide reductase MsrA [Proteobacteria bacterium]|nr:peptide-methionine (S)-S-oxide reductase MsrA [Pseudomonadota bacterium]